MSVADTLLTMLEALDVISLEHEEIFDSEVREIIGIAVIEGFVRQKGSTIVPANVGMFSDEANEKVRVVLQRFIREAALQVEADGLTSFHDRLGALQNSRIQTRGGNDYDEYLGHTPPDFYDLAGNVIRTQ